VTALAAYLALAAAAWLPTKGSDDRARAELVVADAIATVVEDPTEPPIRKGWTKPFGALVLLAVAFEESGAVWPAVLRGECHPCDGGLAFSPWQIHPEQGGIILEGDRYTYANARAGGAVIRGRDLEADPVLAARVALHMARVSVGNWTRGATAMRRARAWSEAHPWARVAP
jgi:hypothetical protein